MTTATKKNSTAAKKSTPARGVLPAPHLRALRGWYWERDNDLVRQRLIGSTIGVLTSLALGLAMLPARAHVAIATAALVLVIPVVAAVVTGGFVGGLVGVIAGLAVFDYLYTPPYDTFNVGGTSDWTALGVYAVVMVLVARVVASLNLARDASRSREANARHLLGLSELLLVERPMLELSQTIATAVSEAFGLEGVALLLSIDGRLEVAGSSGTPISPEELRRLRPEAMVPVALSTGTSDDTIQTLALAVSGRPVGLLVLRDVPAVPALREVLPILANHVAIALEQAQLRERILRAELLEEVDLLRRSLIGAVSHDLRTPLATIKVASTTFLDPTIELSDADAHELHSLIDMQTDRLARLVNSLLDMTRIQSGALEVRRQPWPVDDLISEAVAELHSSLVDRQVDVIIPDGAPLVDVDPVLIVQVLANLIDNANRHGPAQTPITVEVAVPDGGPATVSVTDQGPGVKADDRAAVFERFSRFDTGGRSGLGLAIAKAFIDAHGDQIWVEDAPVRGARFGFTLALATDNGGGA